MSRLSKAQPAVRPALKARMMIAGPAGAGKTLTGLTVASELAHGGKVLWIDTEKESALTYADEVGFTHLPWSPPYDPRDLAATLIEAAHEYDAIGVDSLSHFWRKSGGTLDIAEGKFSGWKVARPAQEDLIDAILGADAHIIVCVRSKIEHVQEVDPKSGKHIVKKLGMAPQQDDTLEYELNVAVEMDIEHRIAVSKSRTTAIPVGRVYAPGHAREMAAEYAVWLGSGEPQISADNLTDLNMLVAQLSPPAKARLVEDWKATGLPNIKHLPESKVESARDLIEGAIANDPGDDPEPEEVAS